MSGEKKDVEREREKFEKEAREVIKQVLDRHFGDMDFIKRYWFDSWFRFHLNGAIIHGIVESWAELFARIVKWLMELDDRTNKLYLLIKELEKEVYSDKYGDY